MREFKNILFVMALSLCVVALEGCGGSGGGGGSSGGGGTNTPVVDNYALALKASSSFEEKNPWPTVNKVFPLKNPEDSTDSDEAFLKSFKTEEYQKNGFLYDFLELPEFYARGITGEGITVGIWDSGFDPNVMGKDTLKARIKGVKLENLTPDKQIMTSLPYPHLVPFDHYRLPNYEFPLTEDFDDDISHGTTMLSFIAAGKEGDGIHGVAYEASAFVIAADTFSTDIITPEEAVVEGDKFIPALHLWKSRGVKVVNFSMGFRLEMLEEAANKEIEQLKSLPGMTQEALEAYLKKLVPFIKERVKNLMTEKVPEALEALDIILVISAGNDGYNENPDKNYENPAFPGRAVTEMNGWGLVITEAVVLHKEMSFTFSDPSDQKQYEILKEKTSAEITDDKLQSYTQDKTGQILLKMYETGNSNPCGSAKDFCLTVLTTALFPTYLNEPKVHLKDKDETIEGSSMATAITTGVIALLQQAYSTLKGNEIVQLLLKSAHKIPGKEEIYGQGILSPRRALLLPFEAAVPAHTASSYEATGFSLDAGGVRVAPSLGALPLLKPLKGNTPLQILFFDKFRDPNRYWVQDINDTFLSSVSRGEEKPVLSFFSSVSSTLKAQVGKGRLLLNKEERKMAYEGVLGEVPYRVGIGGEVLEEEDRVLALASHGDLLEEKRSFSLGSGFSLGFAQGEKEGYRVYSGYRKTFGSGFLYAEAGIVREGEAFLGGRGTAFMEFSNGGRTWYGRIQGRMRVGGFEMNVAAYMGRSFSGGEGSRSSWLRLKEGRSQSGGISIKRGLSRKRSIELGALFPLKSSYVGEMSQLEVLKGDLLGTLRWSQHDVRLSSEGREKLFYGSYTQVVKTGGKIHLSFGVRLERNHVPNRVPESFYLLQYRHTF